MVKDKGNDSGTIKKNSRISIAYFFNIFHRDDEKIRH